MVKFISYDGKYPNLCSGTLVLEINGERWEKKYCLASGGRCDMSTPDNWFTEHGAWRISEDALPEKFLPFREEIEKCINENVAPGCCGGCF